MVLFGLMPPVLQGPERGRQDKITSILKPSGARVEMGIFTNDSHKEISAVFFSTVGTFGKAVVESQIDRIVRSTRYRVIDKTRIVPKSKSWKVGVHRFQFAALDYLLRQREEGPDQIGEQIFIFSTPRFIAKLIWTGSRSISIHTRKCLLTRTFHGPKRSL